ncbi:hypothetical protein F2P56_010190 [Juglans regia]|uniref:Cytochrome P450 94C1-like n=1 Tax=Juglans regia TaxID=51240 RepID=A0A834CXE7_JUGRE|nr:hypothetical protein F2P56_010190 [Juglans regia]
MDLEVEASWFLQFLHPRYCFLVFSFVICNSLLLYLVRLKPWCNCEICHGYLTSNWSKQFDNLCDWYAHLLKNSPSKTIHIHVLRNTITANPDNVEYMLRTRFENYPKGKPFSTILGDFLGRGIFNVDGDLWSFQRKMANLELNKSSIVLYAFNIFNCEIKSRLVPLLYLVAGKKDGVLDLQDVFRRFSFDCICQISFGLDPSCLELSLPIMRLYPPIQYDSKFCQEDDVLPDGTYVRGGTRVTYHPYAMGRIEEIWGPDCLEFRPERWLKDGVFFPANPFKYPVFQAGVRVCLGKEMALVELKCLALSLVRRFHIDLATPGRSPLFSPGLTSSFRGGLPVLVRERETPL